MVSQVVATGVGESYQVSFWGDADTANIFSLTENGITVSGMPGSIANKGFPGTPNSSLFTNYFRHHGPADEYFGGCGSTGELY